jgi:hypothetical protein
MTVLAIGTPLVNALRSIGSAAAQKNARIEIRMAAIRYAMSASELGWVVVE